MIGRPILTADEMRSAEARAIAAGTSVDSLMERAGAGAAEAIWRFAGPLPALILCGPGNNGGDGYVIARCLRERGVDVRVAAYGDPRSEAASHARSRWNGPVSSLEATEPAPVLIDALFGTGLARGLDPAASGRLVDLGNAARIRVAIDLPSGVSTDDGQILSPVPQCDLTISFATLKPSHLLQPAARFMGRVAIVDIGVEGESRLFGIVRPRLRTPGPDDHKYSRGYVAIVAGTMPGASALAASAAARSGAGYVRLHARALVSDIPHAIVQSPGDPLAGLGDPRIGAILLGPGLGRGPEGRDLLDAALSAPPPLILDADALALVAEMGTERLHRLAATAILTPHAGEFAALFPHRTGNKVERARAAAAEAQAVIVFKGPDTVVASPDGRAAIAGPAPAWLATAGTGDVLAGVIAAMRASGLDAFEAACAGVWLHSDAAGRAGRGLVADDLLLHLEAAIDSCL
ncbi:MAG: NAD(P)H-hydrate dehydratase [Alphaproteobacteria bacterium]|nr:NAD(P)H-hydrate dehydratase [Alphaproteobacteria bacterium]